MREIKFRAWDTKTISSGWMIYWVELKHTIVQYWFEPDVKLMQYTGLKDKNGKEIYEGDIVKFDTLDTKSHGKDRIKVSEIIYSNFGTMFRAKTEYGNLQFFEDYTEVIGNIYQNPELLEKKQ